MLPLHCFGALLAAAAAVVLLCGGAKVCDSPLSQCEKPKLFGLYKYDIAFSHAVLMPSTRTVYQSFFAEPSMRSMALTEVDDGTDFSDYIVPVKKYAGTFTTASPYSVERVTAIGDVNGSFFGAIHVPNDTLYLEEASPRLKAAGWIGATAIVYRHSQGKEFDVLGLGPNFDEPEVDLGPLANWTK